MSTPPSEPPPPTGATGEDAAQRRLERILEGVTDGFMAFDREWRFTYVNRRAEEFYGASRDEMLGKVAWEAFPEVVGSVFYEEYHRAVRERAPVDFQARSIVDPEVWLEVRAFPLENGLSVYFTDITERRRVEDSLRESEERFRLMVEGSEQVFFYVHDLDHRFTYLSPSIENVLGYSVSELIGRPYEVTLVGDPSDLKVQRETESALREGKRQAPYHAVLRHRDGHSLVVEIIESPLRRDGEVVGMQGFARDITERRRAETELRDSEARYRSLFADSRDAIYLTSREGRLLEVNRSFVELFEFPREALIGRDATSLYADSADRIHFQKAIEETGGVKEFEVRLTTRTGRVLDCLLTSSLRRADDGTILGYQGIIHDITERKRVEQRLIHNAFHDTLTGLPNRALLTDRLGVLLNRNRPPSRRFAIAFLDLDGFKIVNDSLGHLIGDQLLVSVARRIEGCLRDGDSIARFGGDEFVMLLDDVQDEASAREVVERVQSAVREPLDLAGHDTVVTASVGIAMASTRYRGPEDMIRDADIAMYRAKERGRELIEVFDAHMHEEAVARLRMENDLRHAVERNELRAYFQPIVRLEGGALVGFEALVRWQHPRAGLLRPRRFLDIAEETGIVVPLGWWMLEEACREHRRWRRNAGEHPLSLHVNLSGHQFRETDLLDRIEDLVKRYEMPPGLLTLEITESVLLDTAPALVGILRRLKVIGVHLCIDDFGVGYSSLSYLHRFPIDSLKIDRSFVEGALERAEDAAIIRSVVTLGETIGMSVIPEGVETLRQAAKLATLGCRLAQGHHFGMPLDAAAAGDLVRRTFARSGTG